MKVHAFTRSILLTIAIIAPTIACSSMPVTTRTGVVRDIIIGESSLHLHVMVQRGDEVRWVNQRHGAIQIVFLDSIEDKVSCQRGFGLLDVTNATTLEPQDSVSLCFSEAGPLRYTVRLDRTSPTGELNVPASVNVGAK